jgi:hypothetical protein
MELVIYMGPPVNPLQQKGHPLAHLRHPSSRREALPSSAPAETGQFPLLCERKHFLRTPLRTTKRFCTPGAQSQTLSPSALGKILHQQHRIWRVYCSTFDILLDQLSGSMPFTYIAIDTQRNTTET